MLEELYYYCGGYFGPNERLIVKKIANGFSLEYTKYYQDYVDNGVPHYHTLWSETRFMRWAEKLKAIGFDQWQDKYWIAACDGEQWELRYKFEGESKRSVNGSNAYPDNWEPFQKLIKSLVKKIPRVGFMTIEDSAEMFYGDEEIERS